MSRFRFRRTPNTGPPPEGLLFGEISYSDGDRQLYVGRPDPLQPPTVFAGDVVLPTLAPVATSGAYADLSGLPTIPTLPTLAPVATSGIYSDLTGRPDLSPAALGAATTAQGLLAASALQPAEIAAFESTTQLNARDTANRARANHTGTQPTSTIIGLATVATSGTYADLTGKPILALSYDQTTEPITPAIGATWRERNPSGIIINDWQWSGSLWLARRQKIFNPTLGQSQLLTSTSYIVSMSLPYDPTKFLMEGVLLHGRLVSGVLNTSDKYTVEIRQRTDDNTAIPFSPVITTDLDDGSKLPMTLDINGFFQSPNTVGVSVYCTRIGTAGGVRIFATLIGREVR